MELRACVEIWREKWPEFFPGTRLDELSGGYPLWVTIQNRRAKGEIPDQCFVKAGRRVLIVRDPFLDWFLEDQTTHLPKLKPGQKKPLRRPNDQPSAPTA